MEAYDDRVSLILWSIGVHAINDYALLGKLHRFQTINAAASNGNTLNDYVSLGQLHRFQTINDDTRRLLIMWLNLTTEERQDKDGNKTSQIYSVRLQLQVKWLRTGIDFERTFGQQRPEEDTLGEEIEVDNNHRLVCSYLTVAEM